MNSTDVLLCLASYSFFCLEKQLQTPQTPKGGLEDQLSF